MKIKFTIATLATLLAVGSLEAQQPSTGQLPANSAQANPGSSATQAASKEQAFAKCLSITNQEQVMIARFAKEKSTNEDVKALAATLEQAHQKCLTQLEGLSSKAAARKTAGNQGTTTATNNNLTVDFLQMHQEMSDQCLQDSKEMLSKKEGADFDKCFVGMQVAKHSMMHSSLTVLQRHTSGELQTFITEGLAMNDEHLKAATGLMEKLSGAAAIKTASKSN